MDENGGDPQRVHIALGVAVLALSLIADEKFPLDMTREIAQTALRQLREKYGYTPENT